MKPVLILFFAAQVATSTANAHTGVQDDEVLARMDGMSAIAKEMKIIGKMLKGTAQFDPKAVDAALSAIGDEAERIPALFTPRATDPKSEAKPIIWESFEDFSDKANALGAVTDELKGQILYAPDLAPLMQEIGQTCRACHTQYRVSD